MFNNRPSITAGNKLRISSMRTRCFGFQLHVLGLDNLRMTGCMDERIGRGKEIVGPTRRCSSRLSMSRSMPYELEM